MCGRYSLSASGEQLKEQFGLSASPYGAEPRYNICPGSDAPVVRAGPEWGRTMVDGESVALDHLRWGLIPSWAKDTGSVKPMINARSETVADKPSFRSAFSHRRCLVPANGFYEWKKIGSRKCPFHIHLAEYQLFAFAGLWDRWQGTEGSSITSFTILTTVPNKTVSDIHNRMPVIIDPNNYRLWLDPDISNRSRLEQLLIPYTSSSMTAYPVSDLVNNPRNDGSECISPAQSLDSRAIG